MAAKKKAKKKAKKVAKAAPKAKKATRSAAPKPPRKKRSAAPTSGQSGPPLALTKDKLNTKEAKVVAVLVGDANPTPLNALATNCFSNQPAKTANSWVRNSLRRLVRGKWVEKVGKGTYRLTDAGREGAEGVAPESEPEAPTSEPESSEAEAAATSA